MEETKILLENLKADIVKGKENKMNPNYFHERLLNIKASLKKEPNRYMVYDFNNAAIDIQSEYNKKHKFITWEESKSFKIFKEEFAKMSESERAQLIAEVEAQMNRDYDDD